MPEDKTFYLIRHGETEDNSAGVVQNPRSPLSQIGHSQVQMLAHRIKKLKVDLIISSDYTRTKQTTNYIYQKNPAPKKFLKLFREWRKPTEFEGYHHSQHELREFKSLRDKNMNDKSWHFSDEENYFDLITRGRRALKYLEKKDEKEIVVVSHGAFLHCLISLIMFDKKLKPYMLRRLHFKLWMDNTGITVTHFQNGKWVLRSINDHAHLA